MTNDENLPVMEIDDEGGGTSSASKLAELHWLARLSCCWRDAERLRHEAAKISSGNGNGNSGGVMMARTKMLQTVMAMQQVRRSTEEVLLGEVDGDSRRGHDYKS